MKLRKRRRENERNGDTKRGRQNSNERETEEDNNKDKLSDFPDYILLHILSFLNAKEAVKTCILSTRWKHLWKHLPSFTLSSSDFYTRRSFPKFVNTFLSLRDSSTALNALDFECQRTVKARLLKRILTSVSRNVNSLRLHCPIYHIPFPPSLLSSQSLTSLDLGHPNIHVIFPNSLNLPALTYLKLHFFSFCSGNEGQVEPFSAFNRLNTLILDDWRVQDAKPLCISSTTILNLSIHTGYDPKHYSNIVLFAPSMCTFAFTGNPHHKLTLSNLSSIKQVSIDILCDQFDYSVESSFCLLDWLKEITEIKSLIVTSTTLQALSLIPDILKLKLPFLCNMRSLQLNLKWDAHRFSDSSWRDIKMELGRKSWKENAKLREAIKARLSTKNSSIMDGMIDFLLQNSPSAKLDIFSSSIMD